ncbi:MAG: Cell wall surface anchor family protein [Parcubacteria group bacterium GW2011_GWA1_Parcubacteria_45_10]|nr:MAG: Cell wall surface anchor family protein [Parcubacteria group bacterium GW2011_GWA1_Parcubacteria_45_10]
MTNQKLPQLFVIAATVGFFVFLGFSNSSLAAPLSGANADFNQFVWFNGSTYADQTTASANTTLNDITFGSATTTSNPAAYFGMSYIFDQITTNVSTAGTAGAITWEYWNGSTYSALTVSGATNFTASGTISFTPPSNWAQNDPDAGGGVTVTRYWVRARTSTAYSVAPLGAQTSAREFNLKVKAQNEADSQGVTNITSSDFSVSDCTDTTKYTFREIGSGVYELGLLTQGADTNCNFTVGASGFLISSAIDTGALSTTLTDKSASPVSLSVMKAGGSAPSASYYTYVLDRPITILINPNSDGTSAQETSYRFVNLILDGGTDARTMLISEKPDFSDAKEQKYATSTIFTLSARDGSKTIYARFFNEWHQASLATSKNIVLRTGSETTAASPTPQATTPAAEEKTQIQALENQLIQLLQELFLMLQKQIEEIIKRTLTLTF